MIVIIDNYDSFTYNLVHLVAAQGKEYNVIRNDELSVEEIEALKPSRILISPGPGRPDDAGVSKQVIRQLGPTIPILGVCLGHQAIGEVYGGEVTYAPSLMHGKTSQIFHEGKGVFAGIENGFIATRYHSLVLNAQKIPEVLEVTARTEDGVIMGVRHRDYPVEGVQFHPESVLTQCGARLIGNWLATDHQTIKST